MLDGLIMIGEESKKVIDALSEDELLFEIEKGRSSRFKGDKFAYLKVRKAQIERQTIANNEDTLPAKAPEILQHLKWFVLHGRKYKYFLLIAVIIFMAPNIYNFLNVKTENSELELTLDEIHTIGPTKQRIIAALGYFDFIRQYTSTEESKRLMSFLRPNEQYSKYSDAISGSFGVNHSSNSEYEITIWKNSYNRSNVYGIRFGLIDSTYWSCNDTYFEIIKDINGNYSTNTNPGYEAPCQ